jgi:hypothetical protein
MPACHRDDVNTRTACASCHGTARGSRRVSIDADEVWLHGADGLA